MRVLVCGAEEWTDEESVERVLQAISNGAHRIFQTLTVIVAQSTSVDVVTAGWATLNGHRKLLFHEEANQKMLESAKPDIAVVFDNKGGTDVTADLMFRAWQTDIPVFLVTHAHIEVPLRELQILGLLDIPDELGLMVTDGGSGGIYRLDSLRRPVVDAGLEMRVVTYGRPPRIGISFQQELSDAEISERLDEWQTILDSDD